MEARIAAAQREMDRLQALKASLLASSVENTPRFYGEDDDADGPSHSLASTVDYGSMGMGEGEGEDEEPFDWSEHEAALKPAGQSQHQAQEEDEDTNAGLVSTTAGD